MTNEGQRQQWNNPGFLSFWKALEPAASSVSDALFAALAPAKGEHYLDVGCGGGLTTLAAADAAGSSGAATGVDISAGLLDLARERAREAGIANARFELLDAQVADIPGAPFDAAFSRLGVMFFDNPPEAFANIRRQVKPGGRLAFVCFQGPQANAWFPFPVLMKYMPKGGPPPKFPPPSPFSLGDPAFTRGVLEAAGWSGITLGPLTTAGDPWGGTAGPDAIRPLIMNFGLSEEQMAAAVKDAEAYDGTLPGGGDGIPRAFWVVTATNPG